MKSVIRACAALFVFACGGKTQSDLTTPKPPSSTDSTTPSTPVETPTDPTAPSDPTIPDPPSTFDGGVIPSDPDAGTIPVDGGPPADRRLFPGEDLRAWRYEGFTIQNGLSSRVLYNYSVLGVIPEDGHDVLVITSNFNGRQSSNHTWILGDDDVVQRYGFDPTWYPTLKGPAVTGTSWTYIMNGTRTSAWTAVPTITVPAGTFNDCWRVDTTDATMRIGDVNYLVMCRGVGHVKTSQRSWNGYVLEYELVAKNF